MSIYLPVMALIIGALIGALMMSAAPTKQVADEAIPIPGEKPADLPMPASIPADLATYSENFASGVGAGDTAPIDTRFNFDYRLSGMIDPEDDGKTPYESSDMGQKSYHLRRGTPYEGEWAGGDRFQKWYFGGWNTNQKYSTCYGATGGIAPDCNNGCRDGIPCKDGGVCDPKDKVLNRGARFTGTSIDNRVANMAIARSRDKKAVDGWVSKTADYYRKNFGDELERSEKKRWWGNDEY